MAVERFIPHGPVLDRTACAVTHGGMGAKVREAIRLRDGASRIQEAFAAAGGPTAAADAFETRLLKGVTAELPSRQDQASSAGS